MKIVLQEGIKDCGICCLLSIIRFYGGEVSREYLRELTNTTKNGVSFYQLIEASKELGFDALGVQGEIDNLNVNNLPCIAHFIVNKNYKHFVVIYKIDFKNRNILIMDPAKGKRLLSFSEFNLSSSKNFILLKPIKKLPFIKKKNIMINNILEYLSKNKIICLIIFLLIICSFIFNIIFSFSFKFLLEYAINYKVTNNIINILIVIIFILLFKNISNYLSSLFINKFILILDSIITKITYKQIILLPYLYYKNRTTGEVVSRFKDLNTIKNYLSRFIYFIGNDLISLIIFFIIMFHYEKYITLIVLGISFIFFIIFNICISFKKKITKLLLRNQDMVNSYLIESISNVDTIKGAHLEKRLYDTFNLKYVRLLNYLYKFSFIVTNINLFKSLFSDILIVIIYIYGSYLVIDGTIDLSIILIYQSFFNYFLNAFNNCLEVLSDFNEFKLSVNRIEELFLLRDENFTNNYFYLDYDLNGDICINNLFYKIGNKILFNKCSLVIKRGERILISGESGCGKSTLVKILMRYIEVPYGMVNINKIDINHYHLENIRKNICYVTSNEYLFTDTLRNNICLNKDILDEEFNSVTDLCLLNDIVDSELGFNKMVEENGFNFSNGERQRIILARSLIKKANIYIFDEAFGQIDINREKKLLMNIFSYLKDKTIIVISHRFYNKKLFDRVIKISDGKINEI